MDHRAADEQRQLRAGALGGRVTHGRSRRCIWHMFRTSFYDRDRASNRARCSPQSSLCSRHATRTAGLRRCARAFARNASFWAPSSFEVGTSLDTRSVRPDAYNGRPSQRQAQAALRRRRPVHTKRRVRRRRNKKKKGPSNRKLLSVTRHRQNDKGGEAGASRDTRAAPATSQRASASTD